MKGTTFFEAIQGYNVKFQLLRKSGDDIIFNISISNRTFNIMKVRKRLWKIFPANEVLDLLPMEKDFSDLLDAAGY